jgi:hypothetical protein
MTTFIQIDMMISLIEGLLINKCYGEEVLMTIRIIKEVY